MELTSCRTCGRNFNPESLARHAPICAKNAKKKPRKEFNTQKQRVAGTEINYNEMKRNQKKKPTDKELRAANRKNNWREKHEEFMSMLRANRGEQSGNRSPSFDDQYRSPAHQSRNYSNQNKINGSNSGQSINQSGSNTSFNYDSTPLTRRGPVPKAGFIQCPHCNRNFGEAQSERHIPWCAEQAKKKAMKENAKGKNVDAMKMAIRTQYKPPAPKSAVKKSPKVKSSGYGLHSNSAKDTYDMDRYSDQFSEMRLAPSAGRRAKENVLSNMNRKMSNGVPRASGLPKASPKRDVLRKLRRNCHDCSTIYPVDWAKFCCECGSKRIAA